ncbi:MAG TPA: sulfatase-like hydrolase/transferase [Candidatus Hydrogenedentes bacterium]|nr:sulfatase-like hydrolase/transferase [Candidatus Hydrogenedentota bacterium]
MAKNEFTRGEFLRSTVLGGLALSASVAVGQSGKARRPNIAVVLSDDHNYRSVGYNNAAVKTPTLDRLGREGVIFDHAYIATPICASSRASLLTGLFPQQHGAIALDGSGFRENVVEQKRLPTLAQLLAKAGYDTAFCGKSHLGPPREYGFAEGEELKDPTDDQTFDFAARFIEKRKDNPTPFLLWMAPRQPHVPLRPPDEWLDLYRDTEIPVDPNFLETPPPDSIFNQGLPGERYYRDSDFRNNFKELPAGPPRSREQIKEFTRAYYAVISRLDHQLGKLMGQIKDAGLYENTVFIYLSDNGYHLGNHGLGNKITMHEESVCVPMLLHWPMLKKTGIRNKHLVSSLDLFPTLLDLAGAPIPAGLPGMSLLPLLEEPMKPLRTYAVSECVGVGGKKGMGHRMVRTEQWKYVLTDVNDEALFDEEADPFEMVNVANAEANQAILQRLRGYMKEWMERVGDTHQRPPGV